MPIIISLANCICNAASSMATALASLLNLSSAFTGASSTITDISGNGFDATIKSGRFWTSDGATEKIVVGDISGFGGATRVLRAEVKVKVASDPTSVWAQSSDSAGYSTSVSGGDVNIWTDVSISFGNLAIASATNVQFAYSANDTAYTAAQWAEITIIGDNGAATAEVTIAKYYFNVSSDPMAYGLAGYIVPDISGNKFHGRLVGGDGATGAESPVFQTSATNYNEYKVLSLNSSSGFNAGNSSDFDSTGEELSISLSFRLEAANGGVLIAKGSGVNTNYLVDLSGTNSSIRFFGYKQGGGFGGITSSGWTPVVGKIYDVDCYFDGVDSWSIKINSSIIATATDALTLQTFTGDLWIGARGGSSNFRGMIYNVTLNNVSAWKLFGQTPLADTIGSHDLTQQGQVELALINEDETRDFSSISGKTFRYFDGSSANVSTGVLVSDPDNVDLTITFYLPKYRPGGTLFSQTDTSDATGALFYINQANDDIDIVIRNDAKTILLNSNTSRILSTGFNTINFTNVEGVWSLKLNGNIVNSGSYIPAGTFANIDNGYIGAINANGILIGYFNGAIASLVAASAHSYLGYNPSPWTDLIASSDGTEAGTFTDTVINDNYYDLLSNSLDLRRPNTRLANLVGDGDSVYNPAQTVFDTTKTVAFTVYNDGVAKTVVDLGTPTVGTTTTAVTSSGFTSPTYYVNNVNTTTLSAGFNRVVVVSTAALATDNIEQLKKCGDLILAAEEWGVDEVNQDYSNVSADLN